MSGFAPLIEGFLAYALTMLALTMGVSAIVGAVHHLRRRHARGLRDMVRLLYERELVPLLTDEPEKNKTEPPDKESLEQARRARRAQFIYDMTFMPVPDVVDKLETEGKDYWRKKLESADRLVGTPWYTTLFHPKRVGRRWQTLRYSLAALKDDEFRDRLAASDVGKQLQTQQAWTARKLASWDELVAQLLKRFQTIGGAASETFARHSRGWSVVVGCLLAVLLNVDSLDLLNSYMTDPSLRQQVIERREAILAQQGPAPLAEAATTLAPARARLAAATTKLAGTAKGLKSDVDALASTLGAGEARRLAGIVQSGLQGVVEQFNDVQTGLGELGRDLTEAEQKIRGVTSSLTTSFPIGWKRFPNCSTAGSPDLRCPGGGFKLEHQDHWWWWAPIHRTSSTLAAARSADSAAFYQWTVGVLLTALLLGLGTPFWVQAVSAAFNLRRWVTKKDDKKEEGTGGG